MKGQYIVVLVFEDGEVRRDIVDANDIAEALEAAARMSRCWENAPVGIQVEHLDFPLFVRFI